MLAEAYSLNTTLGKSITLNLMMSTAQLSQVSLQTEIAGSVKFLVGIVNPFRTQTANRTDPTIRTTVVHSNQATRPGHSYKDYVLLGSLDSGTDVPRSSRNIDKRTWMNPQGPTVTTKIPESNSASNRNIFHLVNQIPDLTDRVLRWHGIEKSESENLGGNKIFENAEHENNFLSWKVGRDNSVIQYHKYYESIQVYPNHSNSNEPIPENSTNIGSIHYSYRICAIEKMLSLPMHLVHTPSLVPASPIFTYETAIDPPSPSHES